jgi:hypothetical protein
MRSLRNPKKERGTTPVFSTIALREKHPNGPALRAVKKVDRPAPMSFEFLSVSFAKAFARMPGNTGEYMQIRRAAAALTLSAALAGSSLIAVAGTAEAAAKGCYVTAKSANLRSKATTHSTAGGVAYKGNKCSEKDVKVNDSGIWYKVKMTTGNAKGRTGWIRSDLLHTSADDVHTCIPEDESCH